MLSVSGLCRAVAFVVICVMGPGMACAAAVEGFAEPYQEVDISAVAEPGVVTDIFVKEGEQVQAGQLLAKLDTSVLEATLEIAQKRAEMRGRIIASQVELRVRQRYMDNLKKLFARGHATQAEMDRAELDLAIAEASLLRAEEEQDLALLEAKRAEVDLERRVLRSPIDGIITARHRDVGEATQISDPRVLTLVQVSTLRVNFSVSARESFQLTAGDELKLALPELGTTVVSRVELVAPVFDAKSGTVKVSCVIDNRDGRYRSGMRCLLELPEGNRGSGFPSQLTSNQSGTQK
jgi:RND family efflux transporter MFP subunit